MRHLHHGPPILVLPNAWDAAGARLFELAGFPAVATTSAGIAYSLGCPDGERLGRDRMIEAVRRIAHAVGVPLTADMETGYGRTPKEAAETARLVIEAGAVGLNLEDGALEPEQGLVEPALHAGKVRAVRAAGDAAGVPLVINARTDSFLRALGEPAQRFAETIRRARLYLEAGADCIFVPGVRDAATIAQLVREIAAPVNILAGPGTPSVFELERLGVARVSMGSGPMRATLTLLQRIARELRESGTYTAFTGDVLTHADANRLFEENSDCGA